jgi:hypothetical protein
MLSFDAKKNTEKGEIFRNGAMYNSNAKANVELGKPNTSKLMMNYTTTLGAKRGSKEFRKRVYKLNQQELKEQERNLRRFNADAKKERKRIFLKSLVPLKVRSFAKNLPEFTPKKIYSYVRAEYSNIEQGPVSLPVYEERKKICGECPHRKHVEGYKDPLGFCTKCGCGANPRAQLTVKLKLPATSCPIDKWDEAQGIYEGFWGRIRYILRTRRK